MNLQEQELHYPLSERIPEIGQTIEVAPGIYWLRQGLPFALNHINCWLIEDEIMQEQGPVKGWTVVDCGVNTDASRDAWEILFGNQNTGLAGLPILRVIATHCHPDHIGLADWLCSRWNAPLYMSAGEYAFARMMSAGLPGVDGPAMFPHFKKHGFVGTDMQDKIGERKHFYPKMVPTVPTSYHRLSEHEMLRIGQYEWRIITGFGHSPEHVSLYCAARKVLISGDMVLPRISTNVSVFAVEPEANPVQQYLDSLDKYRPLPEDVWVLPSHGKPFVGLHRRIAQLNEHHQARLAEVEAACVTPLCAFEIVPLMFKRPLDAHQLTFAIGEALAHCHQLWFAGKLKRVLGNDDVYRFVKP